MSGAPANEPGTPPASEATPPTQPPAVTDTPTAAAKAPRRSAGFFSRRSMRSPSEALQPEAAPAPPPPPPSKRRPTLSAVSGFMSFLLVLAVGAMIALLMAQQRLRAPGPLAQDTTVFIAPGTDIPDMLAQLERNGVIDSPLAMQAALVIEGNRSRLKYGEYLFKQNASLRDVIDTLVLGRQVLHPITIPEGLTSEQIVQRLRDSDVLTGEIREIPKEGSLLPETYKVSRGWPRNDLIKRMQDDQKRVLDQIWTRRSADVPVRSPFELVTLASIVEKETGKADERPRVAGVFANRLKKRMRLQSDPTIVYGLVGGRGTLGRGILRSEVEKYTPYNTYAVEGLPPTPIANPGRAAMEAVANPSRTNELYFVADGTGGHVFAETLDQHNRNVLRWRQIEREGKAPAPTGAAPAGPTPVDRSAPAGADQRGALDDPNAYGALSPMGDPVAARLALTPDESALGARRVMPAAALVAPTSARPAAASAPQQPARSSRPLTNFALGPSLDESVFGDGAQPAPARTAAALLDGPADPADAAPGSNETYPVSPQVRAAQKAAAAKYGLSESDAAPSALAMVQQGPTPAQAQASSPMRRALAFDASEGTDLDPLRDKTWDLNSAKVVPSKR
jgi:UPF0755 protein